MSQHPFEQRVPDVADFLKRQYELLYSTTIAGLQRPWHVSNNALGDDGLDYLLAHFINHGKSKGLFVENCGLTDDSKDALTAYIIQNPDITTLHLTGNHFTEDNTTLAILSALKDHQKLDSLSLDLPRGPDAVEQVASLLREHFPTLRQLALHISHDEAQLPQLATQLGKIGIIHNLRLKLQNECSRPATTDFAKQVLDGNPLATQIYFEAPSQNMKQGDFSAVYDRNTSLQLILADDFHGWAGEISHTNANNQELVKTLLLKPFDRLEGPELRMIAHRAAGLIGRKNNPFMPESDKLRDFLQQCEETLPPLPKDAPLTPDALFTPNKPGGFAPLDNPFLWKSREETLAALDALPLSSELLARTTPKRSSLLDTAADTLSTEELVHYMNRRGISISRQHLLSENDIPTPFFASQIARHSGYRLFSYANLAGQPIGDIRTCLSHLPDYQKAEAHPHRLLYTAKPDKSVYRAR